METAVEVEGSNEGKFEHTGLENSNLVLSSPKHVADPVVYKLVRVEGDGRLVPATDDEIMEVEGLLENEKRETHIVADSRQALGRTSNELSSSGMPQLESSEGLSHSENTEAEAEKLSVRLEEMVHSRAQCLSGVIQYGNVGEHSKPVDGPIEGGSSTSAGCISSKPDLSRLQGEICLDNLSIKELHRVFKATFGRDTTVKDKQWLKRRIAMGLTNSCDVSTTTFVIKDHKLVKKSKEDGYNNVNLASGKELSAVGVEYHEDLLNSHTSQIDERRTNEHVNLASGKELSVVGVEYHEDLLNSHTSQIDERRTTSRTRLRNEAENNCGSEDLSAEQGAAKRVRKPTKRYIEELSEADSKEYSGRLITSTKNIAIRALASKSHVRSARNVSLEGRTVIMRFDSLGGSGIQVPCVYRVRRSRPRKNVMALLKFHPSGMGMTATFVRKGLDVRCSRMDNRGFNKVLGAKSTPEQTPHLLKRFVVESKKEKSSAELGQNVGLKHLDPYEDTSNDNAVTVPTAKGGTRRKHHRAWTLSEVMKLVEGVSKYGAGRWSEIRRLAFASYSYRTSVDLKDKWRNLLKASFAQTPVDKGVNLRKHPSMPIPESILLRVRELAEMQAQAPSPNLGASKLAACGGRSVNETKPGYL